MKFGVIIGDHRAEVHEHEIPEPGEHQVLIQNKACNLCTTDYQQWLGLRPHQKVPMAFGHENAGVVVKVGAKVKNVAVGDHVVTNIYHPCMECGPCRKGKNSLLCENPGLASTVTDQYGYFGNYGCAEYMVEDSNCVLKIDPSLPFEQACFCEPLSTVINGINRLKVQAGEKILVIGVGTMGLLNAMLARFHGADVVISEFSERKIETARKMGFEKIINPTKDNYVGKIEEFTDGEGPDGIIIAVGASSAYRQALEVARRETRLLIFASGYPAPKWELDPNLVHYQMLEVIGTYGCRPGDFQTATELLGKGKINVEPLVEARYPLDELQKAFENAAQKDVYRVCVMM